MYTKAVYSGVKDLVAITCDVSSKQFDLIVSSIGLVSRRLGLEPLCCSIVSLGAVLRTFEEKRCKKLIWLIV